eukprot:Opistho-2@88677
MVTAMLRTSLCDLLKISVPIIQAPMAAATTPSLVAAVSNAGGLGSIGGAYIQPEQLREFIRAVRQLTTKPFAVNLFVPEPLAADADSFAGAEVARSTDVESSIISRVRTQMGLPRSVTGGTVPANFRPSFDEQLAVVLDENVPVFSFTFGVLDHAIVQRLKSNGTVVMGTATTVREARDLAQSGVDAIVAQGSEAGGHRGSAMTTPIHKATIGVMALVPQIASARLRIPLVAAGGIMDGRGLAASLMLEADGVQMGTAFLTSKECAWTDVQKQTLLQSTDEDTILTRALSGRTARAVENGLVRQFDGTRLQGPAWGLQERGLHDLHLSQMREITKLATDKSDADGMAMYAGQGTLLCRSASAEEIVTSTAREAVAVIEKIRGGR